MQVSVASVFVDDQDKALKFYTEVLGFTLHTDMPMGDPGAPRWLTVVSPEATSGVQLLLEPNDNPIASTYQTALFASGLPVIVFSTADVQADYERLTAAGVVFRGAPVPMGPVISSLFEDTCGNIINLVQVVA